MLPSISKSKYYYLLTHTRYKIEEIIVLILILQLGLICT